MRERAGQSGLTVLDGAGERARSTEAGRRDLPPPKGQAGVGLPSGCTVAMAPGQLHGAAAGAWPLQGRDGASRKRAGSNLRNSGSPAHQRTWRTTAQGQLLVLQP